MHITVPTTELLPHFEQAYRREQSRLAIKGFRKGKAPLELVKKLYGEAIEYDALSTIANDLYRKATEDRHVHPIGEPVLTDMHYKRGEDLRFKIRYEIKPEFDLGQYRGIAVDKIVHPVVDSEVEDEVLRIRKANSTFSEAQNATDDEHVVTVDVQELDDSGTPLIGKKSSDMKIYLADESVTPEVRDLLRGSSVTETKTSRLDIERDGKPQSTNLQFTVKKIEKVELPALDSELLSKVTKGKITDVTEFRKKLREDIEAYWADFSERTMTDALVHQIVQAHDFTVPESFVTSITDSYLEDTKNQSPNKALPAGFDESKFRQDYRASAIFQAKWFLIRDKIIEAEKLEVSEQELEDRATTDAPKMGIDKDRLLQFYKSSSTVSDRLLTDKLMSLLKSSATITEKTDTASAAAK